MYGSTGSDQDVTGFQTAIAPGYYADIVAVEGDPLANIDAVIHGVRWVMKGGKVVVPLSAH